MKEYVDIDKAYEWFKDKKQYRRMLKEHKNDLLEWRKILKDVIPKMLKRNVKKIYSDDPSWFLYAEQICNNKFMKNELLEREKYICPVCGKKIKKDAVIHHIDYKNICRFNKSEKNIPCCEKCKLNNLEYFNECKKELFVYIHFAIILLAYASIKKLIRTIRCSISFFMDFQRMTFANTFALGMVENLKIEKDWVV